MRRGLIVLLLLFGVITRRFLFVAVCSVFTSNAEAVDIPACGPGADPIKCYTASSMIAVMFCEVESRKAVAEQDLGKGSYTDMLAKTSSFTKMYREQIDPRYDAAARHLAGNRDGMNLLKDYHAFWLGTLESLRQGPSETMSAYQRRLADREAALRDKGNRLELEK